ncbi:MAG: hydrolase [Rhodospirillales bacterium]|nr:hydrolase [Rhodospirillales bacterium]
MLVDRETSCLAIVDIQTKLLPAMTDSASLVNNATLLLQAASRLALPVLVSEQYAKGLGPTVAEIRQALPASAAIVEKVSFSCLVEEAFARRLEQLGRRQIVVAGIEAHVCVLQTADQLVAAGFDVFVVADATASRTLASHQAAMQRLAACGCTIVTTEMVIFEWLRVAATPEFKALSALIR